VLALSTYGRTVSVLAALLAFDVRSKTQASVEPPQRVVALETNAGVGPEAATEVVPPAMAPVPSRVVLVTLDGVRWQDALGARSGAGPHAESGLMPNLTRLVAEKGVSLGGEGCTHDVRASGPNFVSLPGYLEMFTGAPSSCTHNGCPPVKEATIVDRVRETVSRDTDVAVFTSWDRYGHAVTRRREALFLSAGAEPLRTQRAIDDAPLRSALLKGVKHAGYPGWGRYRPDADTSRAALRYLEVVAPRFLVVGLGDADEFAHRGDVAGYKYAVREADEVLGKLDEILGSMGEDGARTAVLVTTDHGRAHSMREHGAVYPESQRVFFAAFGGRIARRGPVCAREPLRLKHLAGAVSALFDLEASPLRAPLAQEMVDRVGQGGTEPYPSTIARLSP
jgi:hypothetical protein